MAASHSNGVTELSLALKELAGQLDGSLSASSPDVPLQLPCWNSLLQAPSPIYSAPQPLCHVKCKTKQDVKLALSFAARHKLKIQPKAGGHSYPGAFLPQKGGGMVLDLSALDELTVDAARRTATAGPGVSSRALYEALAPARLHFPAGHITDVGISGFILGGGQGWGTTAFGAASDNVLAFEVARLAPDGSCSLHTVDEASDPELFWALRGGGPFLGVVVTQFTLLLHPCPPELSSLTVVCAGNASAAPGLIAAFQRLAAEALPPCVEATLLCVGPDTGAPTWLVSCMAFQPLDHWQVAACYTRVREELGPMGQVFERTAPYLEALAANDGTWMFPNRCCYAHSMYLPVERAADEGVVSALLEHGSRLPSPQSILLMGPSAPLVPSPGAMGFRGTMYVAAYALWARTEAGPQADGDAACAAWAHSLRAALKEHTLGSYINEVMLDGEDSSAAQCYERRSYERLRAVRAKCDPLGLFRGL